MPRPVLDRVTVTGNAARTRPTGSDTRSSWRVAALIGALATAISSVGSWIPSLWGDEAASMLSALRPLPSLGTMLLHVDAVHGTYYFGLHWWILVFGDSPFSLRLPSALAIGACVAGMVLLGERLDSLKLGVVAGIVCAVLPRVTYMGEEARSYAFSAAIATWLTLLIVTILQREPQARRRLWIAYTVLLAFGIYTFFYLGLIALAHLALLMLRADRRALVRRWVIAVAIAVAAALPLVITALIQHGQVAYLAARTEVTFPSITVGLWFGNIPFAIVAWALMLVAVILGWRQPAVQVGAAWLVVPSGLLIASQYLVPDFTGRYLSMCAPAAALLIACGLLRISRRLVPVVLLVAVVVGVAAPNWVQQRGPYAKNHSDWAEISAAIAANAKPGDAVVFDESVRPSRLPRLALRTYPAGFTGLTDPTLKHAYYDTTTWHDTAYTIDQAASLGRFSGVHTVWLIEYAISGKADTDGVGELRALGFTPTRTIDDYRSQIIEFVR